MSLPWVSCLNFSGEAKVADSCNSQLEALIQFKAIFSQFGPILDFTTPYFNFKKHIYVVYRLRSPS